MRNIGRLLVSPKDTRLSRERSTPGIALGVDLARNLGVGVGDEIVIHSPTANSQTVLAGGAIAKSFVVAAIFETQIFNFDLKWAVVSLDNARLFMADYDPSLQEQHYVSGIAVNVKDPYRIDEFVKRLSLPELETKTWKQTNSALLFALQLEKFTMGAILMLIVLVAAFSISGTLMMMVFHKKRQISVLRSIGMTRKGILKTYLLQGLAIGGVGVILGFVIGIGVCVGLYNMRVAGVSADLYYIASLPVKFLPWDYLIIGLASLLLTLIGALYPALIASNQNPSQGLRY
jgi:lipoprotein-releasing system permease protein